MYNLVEFEFYKLRHSKISKTIFIVLSILIVFSMMLVLSKAGRIDLVSIGVSDRVFGFSINKFKNVANPRVIELFYSAAGFGPIIKILILFLVGSVISNEYADGTMRNIVSYGHKRTNIYVSKLLILSISIFFLLFSFLGSIVFLESFVLPRDQNFSFTVILEMVKLTLLLWIIFTTIASIYMCLAIFIKNKSIVITMGILSMFLSQIMLSFNYPQSIQWEQYIPSFMLMDICSLPPTEENVGGIILRCSILILITTGLGEAVFNKQDIK